MAAVQDFSIHDWVLKHNFKTEEGKPLDFRSHLFLFEPYCDFSPDQASKKCSQVGWTIMSMTKSIFAMQQLGWNIIYTMPSDSDITELVPAKFDQLVRNNPSAVPIADVNRVGMKSIGDKFLYFDGTISKTGAISKTVDCLIHDETDRSDQKRIAEYQSRITHSAVRATWKLSNPTTPRFGIDLDWQGSDQKEWVIRCRGCKQSQIMNWSRNVDVKKGAYICSSCGKVLTDEERRVGEWQQQNPGSAVSGYHVNQLIAPWIDAKYLIRWRDKPGGDETFFPMALGEPFSSADTVVDRTLILDCWTNREIGTAKWYLGIDVGRLKHWVLGSERGIVKIGRTESWRELEDIISRYNPVTVIDALPDITATDEFIAKYPRARKCYFNKDKATSEAVKYGEGEEFKVVWANRSRCIGETVGEFMAGEILLALDPNDPALPYFITHWETVRRQPKETPLGQVVYEWDTVSTEDHFVFATLYYRMARGKLALHREQGGLVTETPDRRAAVVETPEGRRLGVKEFMLSHGYIDNDDE